eukprot:Plantae.Rhodophyta-Hildenbrandia_rubra.ctg6142.p1 GENE.Plantae.Rhodophyta-Hildenbrandia_rubra.ctg6142~~Plantae.Rhodophyta-Hildenbrandia_rubra.ctg6142.p1  ORF type:complete len:604 (-),score=130.16 Plantae.Rhodophyta-Hildenbrandia_rubra.ctg6142:906-2717(-)
MTQKSERVTQQMQELDDEEARILRELREMDGKIASPSAKRNRQISSRRNWRNALNQLLLSCEREVRDAKGFVASAGPPLQISRVERGTRAPAHATFLSRPRNTGVDFTLPVRGTQYNAVVKNPVWLNLIRDRCRKGEYASSEDYLDDMRLLARNTALYNKDPEVAWVVEHARLLLEVSEDAVLRRKDEFYEAEEGLRMQEASNKRVGGKRKRGSDSGAIMSNGDAGNVKVGSLLDVLWEPNSTWYAAKVVRMKGPKGVEVVYFDDNTGETLNLNKIKWRFTNTQGTGKKRGGGGASDDPVTRYDLDELRNELVHKMNSMESTLLNEIRYVFRRMGDTMLEPQNPQKMQNTVSEILNVTKAARKNVIKEIHEVHGLITGQGPPERKMYGDEKEVRDQKRRLSEEKMENGLENRLDGEDVKMDDQLDDDDDLDVGAAKRRFEVAADLGLDSDMEEVEDGTIDAEEKAQIDQTPRTPVGFEAGEDGPGEEGSKREAGTKAMQDPNSEVKEEDGNYKDHKLERKEAEEAMEEDEELGEEEPLEETPATGDRKDTADEREGEENRYITNGENDDTTDVMEVDPASQPDKNQNTPGGCDENKPSEEQEN